MMGSQWMLKQGLTNKLTRDPSMPGGIERNKSPHIKTTRPTQTLVVIGCRRRRSPPPPLKAGHLLPNPNPPLPPPFLSPPPPLPPPAVVDSPPTVSLAPIRRTQGLPSPSSSDSRPHPAVSPLLQGLPTSSFRRRRRRRRTPSSRPSADVLRPAPGR